MAEAVKKPVGGAYGAFLSAKREDFKKQAGSGKIGDVAKLASAAWKELSEQEKAKYEAEFQKAKEKFQAYKESDDYVKPEKKEKRAKGDKKVKDKDAPKRPVGGAYGVFMNEKREEFQKKAQASGDKSFGGAAKIASATWKDMTEKDKAVFEEKYKAIKEQYDKDVAEYKANKPDDAEESEEAASPSPAKGKRKAEPAAKASAKKKAKLPPAEPVKLDAALLKEADGLGYRSELENLAQRKDVSALGHDGAKLLRALKASGGLVNKAKAALLGA